LPNVSGIVATFWAFDTNCGKRPQLLLLFSYDSYKLLWIVLNDFADFSFDFTVLLLFVPAFWAGEHH
jgi:hypothetical protein